MMDFHPEEESTEIDHSFGYPGSAADESFGDSFPTAADEGFVSPEPTVKNVRRYSGMEIPFGVIEAGSNVLEMNPMMRGSKRLSALFPTVLEDEAQPATDPQDTANPLRVSRRASINPLSSRNKPVSTDEIPFGINEPSDRVGSELNPMRTSGKFKMPPSPGVSPKKPNPEPTPEPADIKKDATSYDIHSGTERVEYGGRQNITTREVPLIKDACNAAHIVLLYIYMLLEILYELGLEAIKPNTP